MNNFVELIKRSFALWWRVKILWPLGMLAALVGSGDAAVSNNVSYSQPFPDGAEADLPPWVEDLPANPLVREFLANPWPLVIGAVVVAVALAIIMALIGALAHGALIRVADVADQGYGASLGDGLRVGVGRMVPIFLINLLLALPIILAVAAVALVIGFGVAGAITSIDAGAERFEPGPLIASFIGLFFCVVGLILLMAVVGALLGVWSRVAQRVCVVEVRGPVASLGRAWRLIRRNLGLTALTWLFQAVLGGVTGFLLAIPAFALALPAIFTIADGAAFPVGLIVGLAVYAILASVLVGGLLTAFNSATWTVMYRAFAARDQPQPYVSYGPE